MVIAVESNNTRMFKKDANNAISRCTKHHPPKCWWLQRLIKMQVKRSPHTVFAVSTIFHSMKNFMVDVFQISSKLKIYGLTAFPTTGVDDLMDIITKGHDTRVVGSTALFR